MFIFLTTLKQGVFVGDKINRKRCRGMVSRWSEHLVEGTFKSFFLKGAQKKKRMHHKHNTEVFVILYGVIEKYTHSSFAILN